MPERSVSVLTAQFARRSATQTPRVLIVDDSAVVRSQLRQQFGDGSAVEVLGSVADWSAALDVSARQKPDLIVLDIQLPSFRGPGLVSAAIETLNDLQIPVIVLASPTGGGAATAVEALVAGAADAVAKPVTSGELETFGRTLVRKVHAATVRDRNIARLRTFESSGVIAFGGSTGGVKPLVHRLSSLHAEKGPIVVAQDLPAGFTTALARHLTAVCKFQVREAENNDIVRGGLALLAPGGRHMVLCREGTELLVRIKDGPEVDHHRPSVELLFRSMRMR